MAPSHGALDALLMTNFSLDSCLSGWKRRREVEAEEDATMQSLLDLIQNQKEAMASPRKKRKSRKKGTSARMFVMDSATGKPRGLCLVGKSCYSSGEYDRTDAP